jgi:[ribosomal protein S5]-alanine N-acetyltransferase
MNSRLDSPSLHLSRSTLRAWRMEDLPSLVAHANNSKIAANVRDRFPHPYTESAGRQFIELFNEPDGPAAFAIEIGGLAVGGIGLHPQEDIHRFTAEMGYWLGEPYWGKGIVSEAARALSDWGFETLGLHRVFAQPFAKNQASIRVLEKAGFEREGLLRRNAVKAGEVLDTLLYARLAP